MSGFAAAIPYIAAGAGTLMSMKGQQQAGEAQKEGNEYNARITETEGAYAEEQARLKLKRLLGTQRALYAKAGVDITSGSPLLVMADTAAEGEKERMYTEYGYKSRAKQLRLYGEQAEKAGQIGATSSFLSGLGKIGTMYAAGK